MNRRATQSAIAYVQGSSTEADLRSNLDFLLYLDDNRLSHVESSIMFLQEILLLMGLVLSVNTLHVSPLACEYNSTSYLVICTPRQAIRRHTVPTLLISDRCRMDSVRILSNVQMFAQSNSRLSKSNMSNAERLSTGTHSLLSARTRDELFSLTHQGEQLTIKTGTCCPTCSKVRRSCLYDGTAILVGLLRLALGFYPHDCFLS